MFRERRGSERESAKRWANFEFGQGRRTVPATTYFSQLPKHSRITKQRLQRLTRHDSRLRTENPLPSELRGGHRGTSHPLWGCGPREPPFSRANGFNGGVYTVFIDGISSSATNGDLKKLFENFRTVVDSFISRKTRKNNKLAFGFVRYKNGGYAEKAIKHLDGQTFFGLTIKVSLAKYGKGGRPLPQVHNRRYSDVLLSRAKPVYTPVNTDRIPKQKEKENKTQVSIFLHENPGMVTRLNQAIIVELEQPYEVKDLESVLTGNDMNAVCISALSPFKVAVFFDDDLSLMLALKPDSPLRRAFADVRRWSDKEQYNERLAWLECVGVHPTCWGSENFKKIGGLWGETIEVEHRINGVNSLTSAKILVRTTYMKKIDTCVTLSWESGSCDMRIYEIQISSKELPVDSLAPIENFMEGSTMRHDGEREAVVNMGEEEAVHMNEEQQDDLELLQVRNLLLVNNEGSNSKVQNIDGSEDGTVAKDTEQLNNYEEGKGESVDVQMEKIIQHETVSEHIKPREEGDGISMEVVDDLVGVKEHVTESRVEGERICSEQQQELENHARIDARNDDHCFEIESVAFYGSCPEDLICSVRFDPIASIECSINRTEARTHYTKGKEQAGSCSKSVTGVKTKKPRGRPRRLAYSLPDPLCVPSTPSKNCDEAIETWNLAKSLGIKAVDEDAVISELRKSKRLLAMEASNPMMG